MPFLTLPAFGDVRVEISSARRTEVPVGEVRRAFSGAPRSTVRAYKREWPLETVWYTRATADSLRTALQATPPIAVTGDLAGSVNVYFSDIQEVEKTERVVGGTRTEYVRLGFLMLQA